MFSNGRDMTKYHNFCMTTRTDNDDAKAVAIPRVFFENSRAEKGLNPFPNKPRFLRVCSTSLLKTLK